MNSEDKNDNPGEIELSEEGEVNEAEKIKATKTCIRGTSGLPRISKTTKRDWPRKRPT